jgi:hypothetical protein
VPGHTSGHIGYAFREQKAFCGDTPLGNQSILARMPTVQRAVGMSGGDPVAVFAEVRHRKDVFR